MCRSGYRFNQLSQTDRQFLQIYNDTQIAVNGNRCKV